MTKIIADEGRFRALAGASQVPVLVDFYADWCGPCRAMGPVLDAVSGELAGQVEIVKVNVDSVPSLAQEFAVRSIPTLVLISGGKEVDRMVGGRSASDLTGYLKAFIGKKG